MRRGRIDTIIDILDAARMKISKTSLVYRTNLNFKLADKYLDILQKYGLVENKSDGYMVTDKGRVFLENAKEIVLQWETKNPSERSGV